MAGDSEEGYISWTLWQERWTDNTTLSYYHAGPGRQCFSHERTKTRTQKYMLSHTDSSRRCGGLCLEWQVLYFPVVLSRIGHVLSDHHDGCFPEGRSTGELKQHVCGSQSLLLLGYLG